MGYSAFTTDVEFVIPKANFERVIQAWREIETEDFLISPQNSIFYDYRDALVQPSVADLLTKELGFEVDEDGSGVSISGYEYEKLWNQEVYLVAAGPFAEPGWHVDWEGEDGSRWRQQAGEVAQGVTDFDDSAAKLAAVRAHVVDTIRAGLKASTFDAFFDQLCVLVGIDPAEAKGE